MQHCKLKWDGGDWVGWYPGEVRYRAPYNANIISNISNNNNNGDMQKTFE